EQMHLIYYNCPQVCQAFTISREQRFQRLRGGNYKLFRGMFWELVIASLAGKRDVEIVARFFQPMKQIIYEGTGGSHEHDAQAVPSFCLQSLAKWSCHGFGLTAGSGRGDKNIF